MNTSERHVSVKTPCIGICSTTSVGDPICRGCKRFAFEVISWNGYCEEEKRSVLRRIDVLVVQIFAERFHIFDEEALRLGLKQAAMPVDTSRPAYTWLHNLLKKHHREIRDLRDFGVAVREAWQTEPLTELIEQADRQLLILCDAHFARYFPAVGRYG